MKLLPSRLAIALASTLIAAPLFAAEPVVTVNGTAISQEQADIVKQMHIARGAPEGDALNQQVRNDLVDLRLIADAATKAGLDKNAEIAARIEVQRELTLMQAYFDNYFEKHPVADKMIEEEYAKVKERFKDTKEYKPRHILVADEDAAKAIIEKFRASPTLETFTELAKESNDPGSKGRGGDLGWTDGNNFVKPFGDAMKELEKGKFTETPVKSDFGYHVIWLEDVRPLEVPSMEELKPQLTQAVQDRMRLEEVTRLRADAQIVEAAKPAAETKAAEEAKPAEEATPTEETKPAEAEAKPAEEARPEVEAKPAEETKPEAEAKPAEETKAE